MAGLSLLLSVSCKLSTISFKVKKKKIKLELQIFTPTKLKRHSLHTPKVCWGKNLLSEQVQGDECLLYLLTSHAKK